MAEAVKVSRVKTRKKNWYPVLAPQLFGKREVGQTYLGSPAEGVGRMLKVNLRELTGNPRDQNAYIVLRMDAVKGNSLLTSLTGYELTPSFVRRAVRKSTNRLDEYTLVTTKDGKTVVVKSLLITLHQVQRSVQSRIRRELAEFLAKEARSQDFISLVGSIVYGKLQSSCRKRLNKIYPLREIAVRMLRLKEKSAAGEEASPAAVEAPEPDAEFSQELRSPEEPITEPAIAGEGSAEETSSPETPFPA